MTWYLPPWLLITQLISEATSLLDCFIPRNVGICWIARLNTSPLSTKVETKSKNKPILHISTNYNDNHNCCCDNRPMVAWIGSLDHWQEPDRDAKGLAQTMDAFIFLILI